MRSKAALPSPSPRLTTTFETALNAADQRASTPRLRAPLAAKGRRARNSQPIARP